MPTASWSSVRRRRGDTHSVSAISRKASTTATTTSRSNSSTASWIASSRWASNTVNCPKLSGRSTPSAFSTLATASSGMSSTLTVGMSTVRPKISGDASLIWASTWFRTGTRLITTSPFSVCRLPVSPSSTSTTRAWARRLTSTHSRWNVSDAKKVSTLSSTNPDTALVKGAARACPCCGSTLSKNVSGSMAVMSSVVIQLPSACCTAGSSAIGPTVSTHLSVLSALRRVHTPTTATVNTIEVTTTSTAARTRRSRRGGRGAAVATWARRAPTSASSRSRSAARRPTSLSVESGIAAAGSGPSPMCRQSAARRDGTSPSRDETPTRSTLCTTPDSTDRSNSTGLRVSLPPICHGALIPSG